MRTLQMAIDQALQTQYPKGGKPSFLQQQAAQSVRDKWVIALDQQLVRAGFFVRNQSDKDLALVPADKLILREYKFHPTRMWRFDRALVPFKLAIEIDGGGFGRVVQCHRCKQSVMRFLKDGRSVPVREGGRHTTAAGMEADHEKANAAIMLGWRVLKFTPKHINSAEIPDTIKALITK